MRAGEQIGKYRLIKPLGEGGEGCVWLSMHMRTEQLWALKAIPRRDGRFEYHELIMFRKLRHSALPMIADVIETDETVFLIMEYIRGETFETLLNRDFRLTQEQVMDFAFQILSALSYMHDPKRNLLHLDLKPANVILTPEGKVRLIDLGAAHRLGEDYVYRLVTDGYSPPELYDPAGIPEVCSDLYALGALMYVCISGVRYSDILIKSKIPCCSETLGNVIRKCLSPEKKQRFQTDLQLKAALQKIQKTSGREQRRTKMWASLLLCIGALGAFASAGTKILQEQRTDTWNYERFLEEAACSDLKTAQKYYLQALFLQPERADVYERYLSSCDSDGQFTSDEDKCLREMLHTIPVGFSETYEEMLRKNPEVYGRIAYLLGLLYWYDFSSESGEGKRIGLGWFEKAVEAAEELPVSPKWKDAARICCQLGSFAGSLAPDPEAEGENLSACWENLQRFMENAAAWPGSARLELYLCRDVLGRLTTLAPKLREQGIPAADLQDMAERIRVRAEKAAGPEKEQSTDVKEAILDVNEKAFYAQRIIENLEEVSERRDEQGETQQRTDLQSEEESCTEKGS